MKRIWAWLLALALFLPSAGRAEKADSFPAYFTVQYKVEERTINSGRCFVSKEHIATSLARADEEINALVDGFDEAMSENMTPDKSKNPKHTGQARWYGQKRGSMGNLVKGIRRKQQSSKRLAECKENQQHQKKPAFCQGDTERRAHRLSAPDRTPPDREVQACVQHEHS